MSKAGKALGLQMFSVSKQGDLVHLCKREFIIMNIEEKTFTNKKNKL